MIPFGDLAREYAEIKPDVDPVISRVLTKGRFVLGEELSRFEEEFAAWLGTKYAVGCASGTEAIALALMALEIGPGDEVLVPANTCVPTATGIRMTGARPVPVDVDPRTLLLDAGLAKKAITPKTRAIMPVHLYGAPVPMEPLLALGLPVVEDCAQAHGASHGGRKAGTFGALACFSFYPSKNLGAYGDGGAVVTSDPALDRKLRLLRNYGQESRESHVCEGLNSRLDEIQAAVLRVKLRKLDAWNSRRRELAGFYSTRLKNVTIPEVPKGSRSSHHLYPVLAENRDALAKHLLSSGVAALIHYPTPLHLHPVFAGWGLRPGALPVAESAARRELSLPLFPQMTDNEAAAVAHAVEGFHG